MVLQEQWLENEAKLVHVRNQTYTCNLPLCICVCMCVYIYKPSNPEHTEWDDRSSFAVAFSFFPEALAKHITFGSEMNYCTQYRNS